jgi:5-methylcytosine-specific restriction endonuclease McrA
MTKSQSFGPVRPFGKGKRPNKKRRWKALSEAKRAEREFWSHFGGDKCDRSQLSHRDTMAILLCYAAKKIRKSTSDEMPKARSGYKDKRSKLHSFSEFGNCFACGSRADCRHHIIQLQHGGRNKPENLVSLCDDCHAEIHPWLKEKSSGARVPRRVE